MNFETDNGGNFAKNDPSMKCFSSLIKPSVVHVGLNWTGRKSPWEFWTQTAESIPSKKNVTISSDSWPNSVIQNWKIHSKIVRANQELFYTSLVWP